MTLPRSSPPPRLSAKTHKALQGKKVYSTITKRSRVKRKRRSPEDFARIYGPKERVAWIKAQPCVWCVNRGIVRLPVESFNAHVKTGGMGYKADYQAIVPLCGPHHDAYDNHRKPFDKPVERLAMEIMAKKTQERWLAYLAGATEESWQAFSTTSRSTTNAD